MSKVIHLADLHISQAERRYSLAVFDEIVELCRTTGADLLLLAGDLFDSYPDAAALAPELREHAAALPESCRAIAIPGNHEGLQRAGEPRKSLELGRITWITGEPFERHGPAGLDLFAIPFRASYAEYLTWRIAEASGRPRIVMLHGTLAGMWFSGFEEDEEPTAAIDPDLFSRFDAAYAALGHLHTPHLERLDRCTVCYPGSARVWRRGESEPRGVQLLEFSDETLLHQERITLATAGRYRRLELPVGLDGSRAHAELDDYPLDRADYLEVVLSGLVESKAECAQLERALQRRIGPHVRRLEIDTEHLEPVSGVSSLPLARRFLEHWHRRLQHAATPQERELLLEARRCGLGKIKQRIEGRT